MFGVFVVAQFWTFCADVYTDERGKRMLPMIAIGATSGAAAGSWIVSQLVDSGMVDSRMLLLLATVPLFVSIVLTKIVDSREPRTVSPPARDMKKDKGAGFLLGGVRLVLLSRFLLAVALVTLLTNWVNTNGENLLFRVIQETLADQAVEQGVTDSLAVLEFTRDGTTIGCGAGSDGFVGGAGIYP
jgi:AAA family ATP:ADP antiporter